ncbi:MAG: SDR family oxidoreductase, partial [Planctomycetaceae bacterium]|nr:SDR family oxidoreductase [Planctomycetaceae bacterium]
MTDPLFSVVDQVVLVSGGSRGIGAALAQGFAERGAKVIITGREEATLSETARRLSTGVHPVDYVVCDVANTDSIAAMLQEVVAKAGRIDVLLNVAGVNRRKRLETLTV